MLQTHIAYQVEELAATGLDNIPLLWRRRSEQVVTILETHFARSIPVVTLNLLGRKYFDDEVEALILLVKELSSWSRSSQFHAKISVLGRWYDLPGRLVEELKDLVTKTSQYDEFFLNLCFAYDAQMEIVDSARAVGRAGRSGKIDPETITEDVVREYLYAPHTPPPGVLVMTGNQECVRTFLFDAPTTKALMTVKRFEELTVDDLKKVEGQDL